MGCPVSKRVQTSAEVSTAANSPNASDENSNGPLCQSSRRQAKESENNENKNPLNLPGQVSNNHKNPAVFKSRQRFDLSNTSSVFKRESTRTRSQVEFFAMLDSKIEAGEDLNEDDS